MRIIKNLKNPIIALQTQTRRPPEVGHYLIKICSSRLRRRFDTKTKRLRRVLLISKRNCGGFTYLLLFLVRILEGASSIGFGVMLFSSLDEIRFCPSPKLEQISNTYNSKPSEFFEFRDPFSNAFFPCELLFGNLIIQFAISYERVQFDRDARGVEVIVKYFESV